MTQHPTALRARRRGIGACIVAYSVCSLAGLEATFAQEQGRVTIDARRCLTLESPAPATAAVPVPSAQPSIPTVDVAALPGQGTPADAPDQSEWVGSITSLRARAPNQYLITLDSGQVWQQRLAERYPLRVGQRVRIYQSRFGLRLEADGVNGFIQVERVL